VTLDDTAMSEANLQALDFHWQLLPPSQVDRGDERLRLCAGGVLLTNELNARDSNAGGALCRRMLEGLYPKMHGSG